MNLLIKEKIKKIIWMLPLILVMISIPLAVFCKSIELSGIFIEASTGATISYDFFTYYRSMLIICFATVAFALTFLHFLEEGFIWRRNIYLVPLFLYLILLVMSSVFSEFKIVSLFGFVERQEGMLVLLGYLILMVSAYQLIRSEFEIKALIYPLLLVSTVVGIIGVAQFFGYDPFNTPFVRKLILPENLMQIREIMHINPANFTIYGTMYNPNYVGSFMALLFPLSAGLYLMSKRPLVIILMGAHSCLMFANWIGCRSRAGLVGATVALIVLLYLLRKDWLTQKRKLLIVFPLILIFYLMNNISGGSLLTKMSTLSPSIENSFAEAKMIAIKDIQFNHDNAKILTEKQSLNIHWTNQQLTFMDDDDNKLVTRLEGVDTVFKDKRYSDYSYTVRVESTFTILFVKLKTIKMGFYMDNTGIYLKGAKNSIYDKIYHAPSIGFEGNEQFGSHRGYVWSRALPLLKNTIWLGNGPDTFAIYFPQEDLVGKLNNFGKTTIIVDKPHNYYIQVAHDTGVLSLIALLSVFLIYFMQSVKLFIVNKESSSLISIGKIILCAVLGYLVTAVFNDSVVFVAPIFWIILGSGFAVNHIVKYPETSIELELTEDKYILE